MNRQARWLMLVVSAALLAGCAPQGGGAAPRPTGVPSSGSHDTTTIGATTSSGPSATSAQATVPGVAPTDTPPSGPAHSSSSQPGSTAQTAAKTNPPAATGKGTIAGHVYQGCAGGPPSGGACQTQLGIAGDTILVSSGGSTVATAVTGADGGYRIDVPAALYRLEETKGRQSTRVQVDAGRTVVADFTVA